MSLQQSVQDIATAAGILPMSALTTDRHRSAQSKLNEAFENEQPVALMIGEDGYEFSHVIGAFLAGLDERVTYVRLQQPQADALTAMREINRALGFELKDLSLSDLQSVLTMFLDYQCKHHRRTVLCVEKADEQCRWLLDCIASLVSSSKSSRSRCSLMVVLAGGAALGEVLQSPSFEIIRKKAGSPIQLAPFSLSESTEFIRQKCSAAGLGDIQSLFEFEAVERLHKLSGGIPQKVSNLCDECLSITNRGDNAPVSGKVVVKAARILRLESGAGMAMAVVRTSPHLDPVKITERLVIRHKGDLLQQIPLYPGRFLVGRAKTTDICLPSALVSRRHALLIKTRDIFQVLDLGSTNGTFAGDERVEEFTIAPGTLLKMGDCEIEYAVS